MTPQRFSLGDLALQYGGTLPDAQLSYVTYGRLSAAKDNAVLIPTWCAGTHREAAWLIGTDRALDPERYFIVIVDFFGNGQSSSPSNQPAPFARAAFPRISLLDNVRAQRRLLHEVFGISRLRAVVGRSMGAQAAFQWASYFPDEVDSILALAGSARTSPHNRAFLSCMRMALISDPAWQGGNYESRPEEALRRFLLTSDAWGFSQTWYREGHHLATGYDSTEAYLSRPLPDRICDANDLLAQFLTWYWADISDNERYAKDFSAALAAIRARVIVMPVQTDLYFPPEDSMIEVAGIGGAELRVIPSIWGHRAGSPGTDPADMDFIDRAIGDLLSKEGPAR